MSDPSIISTLVGGIVSAFSAYVGYRTAVDTAKAKGEPAPEKSEQAANGEQAIVVVQAGIKEHGGEREQKALANFIDDPETYEGALVKVMTQLAGREPAFLAQLRALAQQTDVQPSVQGTVNVSGKGRTYGITAGVITGSVTGGTISTTDNDDDDDDGERPRKRGGSA